MTTAYEKVMDLVLRWRRQVQLCVVVLQVYVKIGRRRMPAP